MLRVVLWTVTLLRICLIPVFLFLGMRAQAIASAGGDADGVRLAVIGVLVAMGSSDIVDGWMARRFGLASQAGAIVDAVADKLVQVTLVGFFALSRGPAYAALPLWFLAVLIGRDLVLGGGLLLARARDVPIRIVHQLHGRATSVLVFLILGWITFGLPRAGLPPLLGLAVVVVVISGGIYLKNGIEQARRVLRLRA